MDKKQHTSKSVEAQNAMLRKRILKLESENAALQLINGLPDKPVTYYGHILDNVPLAILTIDLEGKMQIANTSFIKLFDIDNKVLNGYTHICDFKYFDNNALKKKIQNLVNNQIQFDHELSFPRVGNKDNRFRIRGITIISQEEEVISYMIIIGDITKRKIAEKNLIVAKDKAEEANMLKTAFLSNLSHEIRTPLNHIQGFLELLLLQDVTTEERREYSDIVKSSSDVLLKRIEDLIDISKIETGQMDVRKMKVNAIELLKEIHDSSAKFQFKHKKPNVDLRYSYDENYSNVEILTDKVKLKKIIHSFVDNAFVFTKEGYIEIGFTIKDNNSISFYVKDTGIGIEPKYHESIFEHFRQVDNSSTRSIGGSGLGLAISRGMATLLTGNITMKSKIGSGSTFFLNLADSIVSLKTKTPVHVIEDSIYDWNNTTILIAEYEEVDSNLKKMILGKTGAKIIRAKTGDEAIRLYHENNPDIVIINYDLPVINAAEFAKIIRSKNSMIPILAETDYLSDKIIEVSRQAGIDKILTKPTQKDTLLNNINDLIINSWF